MSLRPPLRRLSGLSDERLLALVRDGHEQAFDVLVSRHRRQLVAYCSRLGLSESRAEDAVQQSFLNAWLAIRRGDEVRNPRAWLTRIAHNRSLNMMQSSAEVHSSELDIALLGDHLARSDPDEGVALRDALADVAALPQMQREALILSAVDGRSYEEVAQRLGVSEGSVRGLVHRARTALRDAAAVLTPFPLLRSATGWLRGSSTSAARALEVASPSADAPMGGALVRGLASAATAAVLAAGVAVAPLHGLLGSGSGHGGPKTVAQRPSTHPGASSLLAARTRGLGLGAPSVASARASNGSVSGQGVSGAKGAPALRHSTSERTHAGETHDFSPTPAASPPTPQGSTTSDLQASSASSGAPGTISPTAEAEAPQSEATPPVETKAPEHAEGNESDDGSEQGGSTPGESEPTGSSEDESERQHELAEGGEVTLRSGRSDN